MLVARLSANSMSMKLRHAAGLALVGWYLMAPPFDRASLTFRTDVPVSEWDNLRAAHLRWEGEFDSENECDEYKTHTVAFWQNLKAKIRGSDVKYQQLKLGECIASYDPRLKEK